MQILLSTLQYVLLNLKAQKQQQHRLNSRSQNKPEGRAPRSTLHLFVTGCRLPLDSLVSLSSPI